MTERPMYYNMDGQPISLEEWGGMIEDFAQKIVAHTGLPGGCFVSTVLLGMDHNFTDSGPPLIFETMVFESMDNMTDLDMERYATKEEAQRGHDAMVTKWTGWTAGDPLPEDAEPSFLTQLLNAITPRDPNEPGLDAMTVMYPKDSPLAKEVTDERERE